MPANYVLLEKVTLSASAASVVFDNIPQTGYTDLKIAVSARDTVDNQASIKFNSSTTGYSNIRLQGTGSLAQSTTDSSTSKGIIAYSVNQTSSRPANTFGNAEIYIPNYAGSTNKSFSSDGVEENNGTTAYMKLFAGLLANTAAISSITLSAEGVFETGSTFYLYGLAAVGTTPEIAPFASGGDIITNDGTYWIHTFLSSGTFTPAKALTCGYLVVAGGGGAGRGGGGAGGLRSSVTATGGGGSLESTLSLTPQAYTVTIGAGGAGGENSVNGSNSTFSTITSTGGGGGGDAPGIGKNGGSGGGGTGVTANSSGSEYAGGTGTANQGFAGGKGGGTTSAAVGAGGGGAGAAAVNNAYNDINSTNGGAGVAVAISGSSVTYAGGGGGASNVGTDGSGGAGGGGAGTGVSGTANTGGGGGGNGSAASGGAGGSGIVIVRYPIA